MSLHLRAQCTLSKKQSSVPSTHVGQFKTIWKSSPQGGSTHPFLTFSGTAHTLQTWNVNSEDRAVQLLRHVCVLQTIFSQSSAFNNLEMGNYKQKCCNSTKGKTIITILVVGHTTNKCKCSYLSNLLFLLQKHLG